MAEQPIIASKNSSKLTFILGVMSAITIISIVGFVILLVRQGKDAAVSKVDNQGEQTQGNTAPKEINLAPVDDNDHIRGSLNAPITVVEYSDLECPFCKRHHFVMQQLLKDYEGKVRWVYRHMPLDSLHSKADKEAEAIECAAELGGNDGFWALTDKIFEVTPSNNGLDLASLPNLAAEVGLDKDKFKTCLDSGKYVDKVEKQYQDGLIAGGQGTPYNIVIGSDGEKVPLPGAYPIEAFKQVIDSMLAKSQ